MAREGGRDVGSVSAATNRDGRVSGRADVRRRLQALAKLDFSYAGGRILGSMCTQPHPLALEAQRLFASANLGDPGHFPGARKIEEDYHRILLRLAGAPSSVGVAQTTSGGSEANILALAMLREATGKDEIVIPRTGHFSFEKAAKFMRMRLKIAEVDNRYRVLPESVESLIGPRTAGIVAIAGTTQVGSLDPIPEIGRIARKHAVRLHVDAAFGGYVLPFLKPSVPFGFDVPGVTSVTLDSHKMGMGTLGAGALLVRDARELDLLAVETPYLSTRRQRGILGTRSAAPVAAAWALWEALGTNGYKKIVDGCVKTTHHLEDMLARDEIRPLIPPELNIVAIPTPEPYAVQDDLTRRGWRVNVLPRLGALRIVCMPHVDRAAIDDFLPDLRQVLERRRRKTAGRSK